MFFSPQEYRKKLVALIRSMLIFGGMPIVIVALIATSMVNAVPWARQITVLFVVLLSVYSLLHVTRRDMDAFKDVAARRKRIERLNAALVSLFETLPTGLNEVQLNFVNDSYATITKVTDEHYELSTHRSGGTIGFFIKPDGIRSVKELPIATDEVDRLIDEIELEARHNSARQHDLPILAGL